MFNLINMPNPQRNIISGGVVRENAINQLFDALHTNSIQCEKSFTYRYQEDNQPKSTKIDIIGNDFIIKTALQRYWKHGMIDLNRQNKLVSMRFKILFLYEHDNCSLTVPIADLPIIKRACREHKITVITNEKREIDLLCQKILEKIPYSTIA